MNDISISLRIAGSQNALFNIIPNPCENRVQKPSVVGGSIMDIFFYFLKSWFQFQFPFCFLLATRLKTHTPPITETKKTTRQTLKKITRQNVHGSIFLTGIHQTKGPKGVQEVEVRRRNDLNLIAHFLFP